MQHSIRLSLVLAAAVMSVTAAQAQTTNKFISATGNDAANCQRATPCKTLQRGIDITPSGAVLQILDTGAYGPAAIAKSITIDAEGVSATTQNIAINSNGAVVVIRGLTLSGRGLPEDTSGLTVTQARAVHLVRCAIERFPSEGIRLTDTDTEMFITDSVIRDNLSVGLLVSANSLGPSLTIDSSRFENNALEGLFLRNARTTISRSIVSGNAQRGLTTNGGILNITTSTFSNSPVGIQLILGTQLSLDRSTLQFNASGLQVSDGTARIANTVVTNNGEGLRNIGGTLLTAQNNIVNGNTTNTIGTLTNMGGI